MSAAVAAPAQAAKPATTAPVCNEAENSFRGGYTITETPDPNPPAFLRGEQMRVGNGHGVGLVHAAERSPALQACEDGGNGGGGDDDDGPVSNF
jgi:hypothetical protein